MDKLLEKQGMARRVAITAPFFLQTESLFDGLPLIAALPERFVRRSLVLSRMAIRTLPFDGPDFDVFAAWRSGNDRNPRISALRDLTVRAGKLR